MIKLLTESEILRLRISLIMARDKFTFINTPFEYSNRLYVWFGRTYQEDAIEECLVSLEDDLIEKQAEDEVVEIPEDFELNDV